MSVNTVVAILIAIGEASSPTTAAMTGAVTEALGTEASLVLRTTPSTSDAEALAVERDLRADAVAHVVWEGPEHATGVLRVHVRSTDRWFERRVTFSSTDTLAERGRTLGFTFASLLLSDASAAEDPPEDSRRIAAPAPATPLPAAVAANVAVSPVAAGPPVEQPERHGLTFDLLVQAVRGVGGPGESLGGAVHAEVPLPGAFRARAGGGLRAGRVPELDGNDAVATLGGGLAFRPLVPAPGRPAVGLGVTLEGLAIYQDLSHDAASGSTLHQGRWLGGLAAGADGSWAATRALDLCLGLGVEVAFGTTDLTVAGRDIGTIPALRLTAQAGLRYHY